MVRAGAVALRALTLLLLGMAAAACRDPTQVRLSLWTDVGCDKLHNTSIGVGSPLRIDAEAPDTTTDQCRADGTIGSLVVVPSDAQDAAFAIRVVAGVEAPAEQCAAPDYAGCIVARRALSFIAHESLELPIALRDACLNVPCEPTTTCVNGTCVPATLQATQCLSPNGCDESVLAVGGSGGAGGAGGAGAAGAGGTAGAGGSGGGGVLCPPAMPTSPSNCLQPGQWCPYGDACCQCLDMNCGRGWWCAMPALNNLACPNGPPAANTSCMASWVQCHYCDGPEPLRLTCTPNGWQPATPTNCPPAQ